MIQDILVLVFSIVAGGQLLVSGLGKISAFPEFRLRVKNLLIATAIIVVDIILGVWLLAGWPYPTLSLCVAAIFFATGAVLRATLVIRKSDSDCGCSSTPHRNTWTDVVSSLVMAGCALLLYAFGFERVDWSTIAGAAMVCAYFAFWVRAELLRIRSRRNFKAENAAIARLNAEGAMSVYGTRSP
ncbi:MauE/DoxX family redox-associated membrane protein [Microbacterium sp.]|uniref:MauE/DoxX family redox-associated membrane protein n=1 Tax=Microbacterium sp. TaxID=51671 RepID=UPI0039E34526